MVPLSTRLKGARRLIGVRCAAHLQMALLGLGIEHARGFGQLCMHTVFMSAMNDMNVDAVLLGIAVSGLCFTQIIADSTYDLCFFKCLMSLDQQVPRRINARTSASLI